MLPLLIFLMLAVCCGCSGGGGTGTGGSGSDEDIPPFEPKYYGSEFHEDKAEGSNGALIDFSSTEEGYIGVRASGDKRLKVQVIKDDETYTYDLRSDKAQIFPLQLGDGEYTVKVMENIDNDRYYEVYSDSTSVTLKDPKEPYMRPNTYADYSESSDCVKEAAKLAEGAETEDEFVDRVYDHICKTITYDYEEAQNVQTGYIPEPDEVFHSGKGICLDYACLAASMLRSQGIPTKIIFGYVGPKDLYHAWNMFYTEAEGWTTVDINVNPGDWSRVDLTFSANGENAEFIGDGANYQEVYQY